jgi:hypothetical protein
MMRWKLPVLFLCLACLGPLAAWACDDPACDSSCKNAPNDPPPQKLVWMETSVIPGATTQPTTAGAMPAARNATPQAESTKDWKAYPDKFSDVTAAVRQGHRPAADLYPYFFLIAGSMLLMAAFAVAAYRWNIGSGTRRLFQIVFLVFWVIVFAQCLCSVKDLAVLLVYGVAELGYGLKGPLLYGICTAWLAVAVVVFTLVMRKRMRTAYCFVACPVGTCQELMETGLHRKMGNRLRIVILAVLAAVLIGGITLYPVRPWNLLGGPVLALLMIACCVVAIVRPRSDRYLRPLVYFTMPAYFLLCVAAMVFDRLGNLTSGPWCVMGVANLKHPLVLTLAVLLATSIVMPRAWCNYVCPNRGLFEILCGKRSADSADFTN